MTSLGHDGVEIGFSDFFGPLITVNGFPKGRYFGGRDVPGNIAPVLPVLEPAIARLGTGGAVGARAELPFLHRGDLAQFRQQLGFSFHHLYLHM